MASRNISDILVRLERQGRMAIEVTAMNTDEVMAFDVAELLRAWIREKQPDDPVFSSERTGPGGRKAPLTRRGVWGAVKGLFKLAGVQNEKLSTHSLRHRFVFAEIEAQMRTGSVNPYLVAKRARHRSLDSTMPYVHVAGQMKAHMENRKSEL